MTKLSQHSEIRLKERCGLNKSIINRMSNKAYEQGITHSETTGNLKRWMDKIYLSYGKSNNTRLYGDKAYLFNGNCLITVIQIPNSLLPVALKLQKERRKIKDE